jgi:hypothetical protein
MTLHLFLSESACFHSLHRPGWAIVEALRHDWTPLDTMWQKPGSNYSRT